MFQVTVKGLEQIKAQLDGFSDRRFNAATATALTRSAKYAQEQLRLEMQRSLDRPTPFTLNALRMWPASADRLVARVGFRDDGTGGVNANNYLRPNVDGGARVAKRVEAALRAIGALPAGWFAVPGEGAALDGYGNMSRGQVIQILSQLRVTLTAGYSRNMAFDARKQINAQRRAGGRFFVMPVGGKVQPGVYQRELMGKSITPVLVFVRQPLYRQRYDFFGKAQAIAEERLPVEMQRSVAEHIAKLAAKGRV
jgi:hypothetical protein